jgi:hypothetical protein
MEFELLLETNNQATVAVVQSLLESEGIPFYVQGEQFSALFSPVVGAARILVAAERLDEAREMIRGLSLSGAQSDSQSESSEEEDID